MLTFAAYVIKVGSTPHTTALVFMVLERERKKRHSLSAENGSCFGSTHYTRTDVLTVLLCQATKMPTGVQFHPLFNFSITKPSGRALNWGKKKKFKKKEEDITIKFLLLTLRWET